jgi:Protein of unknown function (DUF2778)
VSWKYEQKTGRLWHDAEFFAIGYSGHGAGVDNPADEAIANVGPLPEGTYEIGAAFTNATTGPISMRLAPVFGTTFGRGSFLIHGDNSAMNRTASEGCIILPHGVRVAIDASADRELIVVAG